MATKKKASKKAVSKSQQRRIDVQTKRDEPDAKSPEEVIAQAGNPNSPHTVAHSTLVGTDGETSIIEAATERALSSNPQFAKFEIAKRIAHTLANSNLVPDAYRGRPNDCFVAINMGAEIGLEPFQAIQSIAVIDGKPCLYGDGLIGVVRSSPLCEWIRETVSEDGKSAICEAKRKGDPNVVRAEYSMADAMLAGIDSKFNWKKHPKRMLQMRARSYCLRDAFPDVLKGLGVVEEMVDHDDTPPPVRDYELPEKPKDPLLEQTRAVFGNGVTKEDKEPAVTLAMVERAINQSENMKELLKAAEMAKQLNEMDQATARITYRRMRNALMETEK